jgi:hypothetical protein
MLASQILESIKSLNSQYITEQKERELAEQICIPGKLKKFHEDTIATWNRFLENYRYSILEPHEQYVSVWSPGVDIEIVKKYMAQHGFVVHESDVPSFLHVYLAKPTENSDIWTS